MDNNIYASVLSSIHMAIIELYFFFKGPGVWHINPEGPVGSSIRVDL